MKGKLFIAVILLYACGTLQADDHTGTTGASFLKIASSSRLLGIGEAFTAIADDASALTANPAGLGNIASPEILFSHYEWVIDLDYEHLAFVQPVFKGLYNFKGIMGFGITYLHLPSFNRYDDWGENAGQMNMNGLAFILGYGQQIFDFNAGLSLKLIREEVDDVSDYAFGTDLGVIYNYKLPVKLLGLKTYGKTLKIGLTLQNIGLDSGIMGYRLPLTFKFGMSTEIFNDFQIAMDLEKPNDNKLRYNTGFEYNIRNYVHLRAGYRFLGYRVDSFTVGLGVSYPFGNKLVKVDATYAPEGPLKNTTDLSVTVRFPGVTSEKDWKTANILYYKGIYYYTNGDLEKAVELWQEVLRLNPDHTRAKEKIKDAEYLKKLKEVEKDIKNKYIEK